MIKRGMLIVVSGPSGVGKDTVVQKYLERNPNCVLSVSNTTRTPRPGEVEGKDYHYISRGEFQQLIAKNDMLEYAEYGGNYYGTPKREVDRLLDEGKHVILVIEVQGARQVRGLRPDCLSIFIMPPSLEELRHRLENRKSDTPQAIKARLDVALLEMEQAKNYDYILFNCELEECIQRFSSIIAAAECSPKHMPELLERSMYT